MIQTRSKLESEVQSDARDYAKIRGWIALKMECKSKKGWPDFYYLRRGRHVWVEWKREDGNGVLSEQQIERHKEIVAHGGEIYVFDNLEDFKKVMK